MQELTLNDVLKRGAKAQDEEVTRLASLVTSHMESLQSISNGHKDDEFYEIVKEVSFLLLFLLLY